MIFESLFRLSILILIGVMFNTAVKSYTQNKQDERDYR